MKSYQLYRTSIIGVKPDSMTDARYERLLKIAKKRGGPFCCYCGERMTPLSMTIEHLEAKSNGGTDGINNLFLAHKVCNSEMGNQSVEYKLKKLHWKILR